MECPTPFDAYGRYYDIIYRDKDYVSEVRYVDGLLNRFGAAKGELLEFGSGTGRHGRLLAELGFRVLGVERSAEMLALAQPVEGFSCQQGDICSIALDRKFNAVLALFHVVSYQVTNRDVSAVFDRAAEHLNPGGLFIFDIWYSPAVFRTPPEVRIKRMADEEIEIIRIAEPTLFPEENRVDVSYTILARARQGSTLETFEETHSMRHFSLPELDLLAANAGFERLAAESFLTGTPIGPDTWGPCIVLRKL